MPAARISPRALVVAVIIAFGVGIIGSLALRPASSTPLAMAGATDAPSPIARIKWRLPVAFGTNLPALGDNILTVVDLLARASSGGLVLQTFEPGDIVPAFGITDAVAANKIPAGYTWLGYDQGRIPAAALLAAVPFGFEPVEYVAWWYEGEGRALGEALYRRRGVHPLLCGLIGPETAGWFREPINELEDLQGLKIRFAGIGGKVLERLGASVTMIPGSELFQALEKGAIDATEYSLPIVDEMLGFDRIAPYNYFPGWHQTFTAAHLLINLQRWEALSSADQALLEMACTAGVTRNLARSEYLQGPVVSGFRERGVITGRLPEPLLRELAAVTGEVLDEEAAANAEFAEILASQRAFTRDYAPWKRLAYLPRDF